MPIPDMRLDDRGFEDLVTELLSRIPAHTPEWTNPRVGDPGRTLIELFAWLGDTLLYRANLIPERQRLAFLRLLNIPLLPAVPASGIVTLEPAHAGINRPIPVPLHTPVQGPLLFETTGDLTVLPIQGIVFAKRKLTPAEREARKAEISALRSLYNVGSLDPYFPVQPFADGMLTEGFDFGGNTVDRTLWIALVVPGDTVAADSTRFLDRDADGPRVLNVGLAPPLKVDPLRNDDPPPQGRGSWIWEISAGGAGENPQFIPLTALRDPSGTDPTGGFTTQGVVRLALPDREDIKLPENDADADYRTGVAGRPPRVDDPALAKRLVAWLRLRPRDDSATLPFSWAGINAAPVDQRKTLRNLVLGAGTGLADQVLQLPVTSVDSATFMLFVDEDDRESIQWRRVDDIAIARPQDPVFELDAEAGTVTFGDGVRGRVPAEGARIRIERLRGGGGAAGNLLPGNITAIPVPGLKVLQPLPLGGGRDAEELSAAEKRIGRFLRHRDRAVTEEDYRNLAVETPGVRLGRVEVLPMFRPHDRRPGVPGIVSVMVIPASDGTYPPNPRPDRQTLDRVADYLKPRRPLGTELYVIGPEYISIAVGAAVTIADGYSRDETLHLVQAAVRTFLHPLAPGGHNASGWKLGYTVLAPELEVIVARVPGVRIVNGISLHQCDADGNWHDMAANGAGLEDWQLPELDRVAVVEGTTVPSTPYADGTTYADGTDSGVAGQSGQTIVPVPLAEDYC